MWEKQGQYITFYERIDMPGYYLMNDYDPYKSHDLYERITRTGKWDDSEMEIPYGYIRQNVKPPVCCKLPFEFDESCRYFKWYIKNYKVEEFTKEPGAGDWGLYKFKEEINIEKWLQDYFDLEKKEEEEEKKSRKPEVIQTSLF